MPIKKEIIFGILSSIIVILLSLFLSINYQQNQSKLILNNKSTNKNKPITNFVLNSAEISKHNSRTDCWMIINNKIYALSSYMDQHPGGAQRIIDFCGKDGTTAFDTKGGQGNHSSFANSLLKDFYVGDLNQTLQGLPSAAPTNNSPNNNKRDKNDDKDEKEENDD